MASGVSTPGFPLLSFLFRFHRCRQRYTTHCLLACCSRDKRCVDFYWPERCALSIATFFHRPPYDRHSLGAHAGFHCSSRVALTQEATMPQGAARSMIISNRMSITSSPIPVANWPPRNDTMGRAARHCFYRVYWKLLPNAVEDELAMSPEGPEMPATIQWDAVGGSGKGPQQRLSPLIRPETVSPHIGSLIATVIATILFPDAAPGSVRPARMSTS